MANIPGYIYLGVVGVALSIIGDKLAMSNVSAIGFIIVMGIIIFLVIDKLGKLKL